MNIHLSEIDGISIAEVTEVSIRETQDAVDIIGNCAWQGATHVILRETDITPDFFDLSTGIAGDILQKFSTYGIRLAIVGDFTRYPSERLKEFIGESNRTGRILFVNSAEQAKAIFTGK